MRYELPTVAWLACLAVFSASPTYAEKSLSKVAGLELFEKHIRPVLVEKCYSCHAQSAEAIEGGVELDTAAGIARGGDSGSILDLEKPGASTLLRVLRHEEGVSNMPAEEKLDEEVVLAFEQWIRLGAPDPRDGTAPTAQELQYEERLKHWAFQPPKASPPPSVKQADWPHGKIDFFILARLEAEGLQPGVDANRATLVRRLYFDLIGLPPTPEEVDRFVEDPSANAVSRLVDRLLASPRFGERWGRHWLDVVRFAESSGKEFNFTYPHAWPYRDYVIDSFNRDKSYDLFVREQIAGDLMPGLPYETPEDREARLIATSMLSFGPKRHSSLRKAYRMEIVDDQIDVTCRAILGVTVACAKCHDHKFDPVPTKDYYALAGIFLSTEPLVGTIKQKYSNFPTDLLPLGRKGAAQHAVLTAHLKMIEAVEKPWNATKTKLAEAETAKKATEKKKTATEKQLAAIKKAGKPGAPAIKKQLKKLVAKLNQVAQKISQFQTDAATLEAAVAELKKKRPPAPEYAMSARDRGDPADTRIAIRGNLSQRGDVAPRGFLTALKVPDVEGINPNQSGRLELARWMTSQHNPLPARVMVNRIWHHLMGRGLVETVDNFGLMGQRPSHPELLDTLAVQFMEQGWSVKRMIRSIVLSRTYQLGCGFNAAQMSNDPDNRLLWRSTPRRLPVEIIRDAILAVSGQLEIDPPHGSSVTALGDRIVRNIGSEKLHPPNNHRGVYLPVVRNYASDMFDRFDFPSAALVSGKRAVTNVPTQALFLRNSDFVAKQANHAARRLLADKQAADDANRIDLAMRWSFSRSATQTEREEALKLIAPIQKSKAKIEDRDVAAWAVLFQALFTTAEFRYLVDIELP